MRRERRRFVSLADMGLIHVIIVAGSRIALAGKAVKAETQAGSLRTRTILETASGVTTMRGVVR